MESKYVQYEYLSINVKSKKEPMYIDIYESFGWNLITATALVDVEDYYINHTNISDEKMINIKFKRDRKINNKEKLNSLQRECEENLKKINNLEKEPFSKGTANALTFGLLGCVFLAISVFFITGMNSLLGYIIGTPIGIVGIAIWAYAYFKFKSIKEKLEEKNSPVIEEMTEKVYLICSKAHELLGE